MLFNNGICSKKEFFFSSTVKFQCSICNDDEDIYECKECLQIFCFIYLSDHRENIKKQFNQIENDYNSFRKIFYEQKGDPEIFSLIKQIDQWKKIQLRKLNKQQKDVNKY